MRFLPDKALLSFVVLPLCSASYLTSDLARRNFHSPVDDHFVRITVELEGKVGVFSPLMAFEFGTDLEYIDTDESDSRWVVL